MRGFTLPLLIDKGTGLQSPLLSLSSDSLYSHQRAPSFFNTCFLSAYSVVGSVLGAKDIKVNKTVQIPASYGLQLATAISFSQLALFYCLHALFLFEGTLFFITRLLSWILQKISSMKTRTLSVHSHAPRTFRC